MCKLLKVTITTVAIGIATFSLSAPARAGSSDVGAALLGFGVGAMLGSALTPEVYVGPPPYYYYGPLGYGPPPPPYYADDYYDVYGSPQGKWKSHRLRAPVHTSPDTAGHEPRSVPTHSTGGAATGTIKQKSADQFKAAQAKAKLSGVATLTQKDIEGLSLAQIKQLRGY
jgi:hypothetical protein